MNSKGSENGKTPASPTTEEKKLINFKGIREGLLVSVGELNSSKMKPELNAALAEKNGFFKGSRVVLEVGQRIVDKEIIQGLRDMLTEHDMELYAILSEREKTKDIAREMGLATRIPGSGTDLDGRTNPKQVADELQKLNEKRTAPEVAGSNALFVRQTLRSGKSVFHEGDVVVLGDVNPGAEVVAGGDVIVWGRARGVVHAGAMGDETAVICALDLSPTQLRIAEQIAIPPQDNMDPVPEMAQIRDGQIVAEGWTGN